MAIAITEPDCEDENQSPIYKNDKPYCEEDDKVPRAQRTRFRTLKDPESQSH